MKDKNLLQIEKDLYALTRIDTSDNGLRVCLGYIKSNLRLMDLGRQGFQQNASPDAVKMLSEAGGGQDSISGRFYTPTIIEGYCQMYLDEAKIGGTSKLLAYGLWTGDVYDYISMTAGTISALKFFCDTGAYAVDRSPILNGLERKFVRTAKFPETEMGRVKLVVRGGLTDHENWLEGTEIVGKLGALLAGTPSGENLKREVMAEAPLPPEYSHDYICLPGNAWSEMILFPPEIRSKIHDRLLGIGVEVE